MRIVMVLAGCALLGCASGRSGGGGGGDDDAGVPDAAVVHVEGTLTLDPPVTTVTVENGVPVVVPFTATLTALDGTTKDVTADTRFQIDPVCCEFAGNKLTVHGAIKTKVVAAYADKAAFGDLTARLRTIRVDTSVPASAPALFDHPDTAGLAPAIVYPPADPVMPRNLGDFEVHWTDANALDVFEVSLHTELADVKLYVRGDVGAAGTGTNPRWSKFSAKEWLDTVGNASAVTLRVRGVNTAAPGAVGGGAPRTALLSNEVMDGGLYYWATATGAGSNTTALGIYRHDMKKPGERAEEYVTTAQTGGRCVACHVLSRDGKKMAITYQDPKPNGAPGELSPPGPAALVEVETRRIDDRSQRWQFATFTPDNAQLLSVDNGVLVVRDTATQAVLATMPIDTAGVRVAQPDLSPDGTKLVYVRYQAPDPIISFVNGRIYTRTYDAATHAFGPEVPLVTTAGNNFYPSWSPDGAWVLYNHAAGDDSYDNNAATTWVIKAEGGTAVQLALAGKTFATDAWPRWAPFGQTLGEAKEKMFWVTLSSKRSFGVRLDNNQPGAKRAQIWMTPMFPGRAALGQDPSAPAFRLPFQNLDSSNHIAQWTERVVVVIQ